MKSLSTLILIACFALTPLAAQHYYVLSVNGEVRADGKALQKKDKLSDNSELHFDSPEAFVYVIAPGKGYYILSGRKNGSAAGSEIVLALKEALLPPNEYYTTSTKSGALRGASAPFVNAGQLQAFFKGPVLLIAPATFEVDPVTFPLDEQHYFQLTHSLAEGTLTRKLPASGMQFRIDESVYGQEEGALDPDAVRSSSLSYIDETTRNRLPLGSFSLHLLSREHLLEELRLLHEAVTPVASNVFFLEHAQPYLRNSYGEADWGMVRQLVKEHFGE